MDLLGSILNSMDAPPKTEDKEARDKKRKMLKQQKEERRKIADFREKIEKEINELIEDTKRTRHKYPPMNKIQRSIIHDVAEVAGLTTFSFGEDEVDRYVMLFKKEFPPSDEELDAYRNGLEYDPNAASKIKDTDSHEMPTSGSSNMTEKINEQDTSSPKYWPMKNSPKLDSAAPAAYYKDKYKHLLGTESGKAAAKATRSNTSYGVVPSENKRDLRSIEETLNDIKRKKQKRPKTSDQEFEDEA